MSSLYVLKRHIQRRLPPRLQHKMQEWIYFCLYRLSPARHQNFFNSGYTPAGEPWTDLAPFSREPLQAQLYDEVLSHFPEELRGAEQSGRLRILDIGCGLGGGIQVARHRFPHAHITGVDVDRTAIGICRKRLRAFDRVEVIAGSARDLPFEDATFDLIFSVGAAGYVGLRPFLEEASRVLKSDGTLSFSVGYTGKLFEKQERFLMRQAKANGLAVTAVRDITQNVFDAITEDCPRRLELINRVPRPFRGYAMAWADMPGSIRYQEYAEGRRLDFIAACVKGTQR